MRNLRNRFQILDGANLVVCRHDRHNGRVIRNHAAQLVKVNAPQLVHIKISDAPALLFKGFAGIKHRVVLDFRSNNMPAAPV